MTSFFSVLVLISSIVLIISVIVAEPAESNMNVITGGASESFWEGNKSGSKEALLNKITIVASVVFVISLLLLAKF